MKSILKDTIDLSSLNTVNESDFTEKTTIDTITNQQTDGIIFQSKIANQIRALLENHGIAFHKQRKHVAFILGISYQSSRRLLIGETQWSEFQIDTVLKSINLIWSGLQIQSINNSLPLANEITLNPDENKINAKIVIDNLEVDCLVKIAKGSPPIASDSLCLISNKDNKKSIIVRSANYPDKTELIALSSIEIKPVYESTGMRVAILDDNEDVLTSIGMIISIAGFRYEGFSDAQSLIDYMSDPLKPAINAYLLDWSLGNNTHLGQYMDQIRRLAPNAAMIVMSGHFDSDQFDFLKFAQKYSMTILPKPSPSVAIIQHLLISIKDSNI